MVLALVLSIMSSRNAQPESILRQDAAPAATVAPQPVLPGAETSDSPEGTVVPEGPGNDPDESGNTEDPGN